jgi:hypothetical protein
LVIDPALHILPVHGMNLPFRFYSSENDGAPFRVFYCLWEDRAAKQNFAPELLSYRKRMLSILEGRRNSGQRSIELALWGAVNDSQAENALRTVLPEIITMVN